MPTEGVSDSERQGEGPGEMDPSPRFATRLNEHGYSFHYAVLERAGALFADGRSRFVFDRAEVPVEPRGKETRIDGVLKDTATIFGDRYRISVVQIAIETKRVNPAWSSWCFARAPYVRRGSGSEGFHVDRLERQAADGLFVLSARYLDNLRSAYHVGFEAKTKATGDQCPKGGTIEDSIAQVLRGIAGLADLYASDPATFSHVQRVTLIPVVVTTAALWVTDAKLESADLVSGELPVGSVAFRRVSSVALQYHRSPSLTPGRPQRKPANELSDLIDREYSRTVHIVNVEGMEVLLAHLSEMLGMLHDE